MPRSPESIAQPKLAAVILAGGASTRMGADKAFLNWEGQPLLRRQIELVWAAGASTILISGRRGVDYSALGCTVVFDSMDGAGPLAGLVAALRAVQPSHEWLLALAVDLPRMTSVYLNSLASEVLKSELGLIPKRDAYFEPLAAVYPVGPTLTAAEAQLAAKHFALQKLATTLVAQGKALPRTIAPGERNLFANWNDHAGPLPADGS